MSPLAVSRDLMGVEFGVQSMGDPVSCPACGWTGEESDIEQDNGDSQCPVCAAVIGFGE